MNLLIAILTGIWHALTAKPDKESNVIIHKPIEPKTFDFKGLPEKNKSSK
jgi:hypothetical protein